MSLTTTTPVTPLSQQATEHHDVAEGGHLPADARLHHRTRGRTIAASHAPPGRYLVVGDGSDARLFALDAPVTHIGRGMRAQFAIEDHTVSRQHAIVARRSGGCRLFDDRSLNGTFVNGRRVLESALDDDDVIVIGRMVLRYREIGLAGDGRPDALRRPAA